MPNVNSSAYTSLVHAYATGSDREYRFRLKKSSDSGTLMLWDPVGTTEIGPVTGQRFIDVSPGTGPHLSAITWDGGAFDIANATESPQTVNCVVVDVKIDSEWRHLGMCYFATGIELAVGQRLEIGEMYITVNSVFPS